MKPTEIKEELIKKLNSLTLDDLFADPKNAILHGAFQEITDTKSTDEMKSFLCDQIKSLNTDISKDEARKIQFQIDNHRYYYISKLKDLDSESAKIDRNIAEIENGIRQYQDKRNPIIEQLKVIDNEIVSLNKISDVSFFNDQLKSLNSKKQDLSSSLDAINKKIKEINDKLESLKKEQKEWSEKKDAINDKEIQLIKDLEECNSRVTELEQEDKDTVIMELDAIDYVSSLLFNQGYDRLVYDLIGYRNAFNLDSDPKAINYQSVYPKHLKEIEDLGLEYRYQNIKHENCLPPANWQKIVHQSFSNEELTYAGILFKEGISDSLNGIGRSAERISTGCYILKNYLTSYPNPLPFNSMELSYVIALKQALKSRNPCIRTSNNGILMQLSGGISAEIYFREKGKINSQLTSQKGAIYRNMILSDKYYVAPILYSQAGYDLTIDAPCGFYILSENHAIEIYFRATPILMDTPNFSRFAQIVAKVEADNRDQANQDSDKNDYYDDYWEDD